MLSMEDEAADMDDIANQTKSCCHSGAARALCERNPQSSLAIARIKTGFRVPFPDETGKRPRNDDGSFTQSGLRRPPRSLLWKVGRTPFAARRRRAMPALRQRHALQQLLHHVV